MKHVIFYLKFIGSLSLEVIFFTAMSVGMKIYETHPDLIVIIVSSMFGSSAVIMYIKTLQLITAYLKSLRKSDDKV